MKSEAGGSLEPTNSVPGRIKAARSNLTDKGKKYMVKQKTMYRNLEK